MQSFQLLLDWHSLRMDFGIDGVAYSALAMTGTLVFLLRLGFMLFLGLGDPGVEGRGQDGFPLISILSITSFLMGAGWAGLVARVDLGLELVPASLAAAGIGLVFLLLAAGLVFGARRLAQDPDCDVKNAVGRPGQVYAAVPAKGRGTGQVRVSVSGRSLIVSAVSVGPAFESFTPVTVVDARDGQTLVVGPASV